MSKPLKPQEYYFLYSPTRAVPEEMLKYTFQSLVLEGHLQSYYKYIYINPNEKRTRCRLFLSFGKNYNPLNSYSKAEQFVLSLFTVNEELRPYEIRIKVLDKLDKDLRKYRTDYVYQDVYQMGYVWLNYFLTSAGRSAKKEYATVIELLEMDTTDLLKNQGVLQSHLKELGTGIILVDEKARDLLAIKVPDLDEIAAVFEVITGDNTYGSSGMSGGFGGGYGGGGYSGGGGFGGFGGGSFGGGGSGGSW